MTSGDRVGSLLMTWY